MEAVKKYPAELINIQSIFDIRNDVVENWLRNCLAIIDPNIAELLFKSNYDERDRLLRMKGYELYLRHYSNPASLDEEAYQFFSGNEPIGSIMKIKFERNKDSFSFSCKEELPPIFFTNIPDTITVDEGADFIQSRKGIGMDDLKKLSNEELLISYYRYVRQDVANPMEEPTRIEILCRLESIPCWISFKSIENPPPRDGTSILVKYDAICAGISDYGVISWIPELQKWVGDGADWKDSDFTYFMLIPNCPEMTT